MLRLWGKRLGLDLGASHTGYSLCSLRMETVFVPDSVVGKAKHLHFGVQASPAEVMTATVGSLWLTTAHSYPGAA